MKNKNDNTINPVNLYHYTSLETFSKILSNRTLRLSDLTKSNDSAEIISLEKRVGKGYQLEGYSIDSFLWLGICFSELKDDLHMWSEYGGNGVSVGFSFDGLQKLTNQLGKNKGTVEYNESDNNFGKVIYKLNDPKFYSNPDLNLFVKSAFVKGESFSCEKEWRLVVPVLKGFAPSGTELSFSNNCLDVSFDLSMIKEVVVSDACKWSEDELLDEMKKYGFDNSEIKISRSKVTYRPRKK